MICFRQFLRCLLRPKLSFLIFALLQQKSFSSSFWIFFPLRIVLFDWLTPYLSNVWLWWLFVQQNLVVPFLYWFCPGAYVKSPQGLTFIKLLIISFVLLFQVSSFILIAKEKISWNYWQRTLMELFNLEFCWMSIEQGY